jgi:hypothetical protein
MSKTCIQNFLTIFLSQELEEKRKERAQVAYERNSSGLYKALFAPEEFCCSTPTRHILEEFLFVMRSYDVCCLRVVEKTYIFNVCKLARFAITI